MTLARYLSRLVGTNVLLALLGLTGLMQLVDLLDSSGTLLAAGEGLGGMGTYAIWRLPTIAEQMLPISILAGTLTALFGLVRHNEIVAMRAGGVTSYRILLGLVPVAIAASAAHFLLDDRVTPWTESRFAAWWQTVEARAKPASGEEPLTWMRIGDAVVSVGGADAGRASLTNIGIRILTPSGSVERRVDARSARHDGTTWRLDDVRDVQVGANGLTERRVASMPWPDRVPAQAVLAAVMPAESLSFGQLLAILRGESPATNSESHYRTMVHRKLALALTAPLMILLAMPAAFGSPRLGGAGRGILLGGALGIASLVAGGILSALGGASLLPPILAAWAAPVVFALIGGAVLVRLEEP